MKHKGHKGHDAKYHESHMKHDGHAHGHGMAMSHAGYIQGNMEPHVKDYEAPMGDFSQEGFSKTLQYIERQDRVREEGSATIRKHGYMGRYS